MNKWKKLIVGSSVGNVLELYDFILYGYFATIISQQFFPASNSFNGLALTFTVFASGCLMRPLGSILFGYIGDKFGRKLALVISLSLISIATTLMGILPTYQQIGFFAPLLLVFCRLMQGLSMSGEEMGAAIFLMENAPENKQGLAGSIILGSVYIGLLLSSIVVLIIINIFSPSILMSWAWRIPFLMSFLFGIMALYIRLKQFESPCFINLKKNSQLCDSPVRKIFKNYKKSLIVTLLLSSMLAVGVYLLAVYFPAYLISHEKLSMQQVIILGGINFILTAAWTMKVGDLVDKFGAYIFMKLSCFGFIIFSYPMFILLGKHTVPGVLSAECILGIFLGLTAGSLMPMLIKYFPANVRYTGICIGFNTSMTIFGSLTPLVSIYLTKWTGSPNAPFLCLIIVAVLTLCAVKYTEILSYTETTPALNEVLS